uniref:Bm10476 n=1 Tax=Brugia malayi TaxID=6279 RepID=A0A0J9XYX1_BRUMA|nr:Bm10476 [Brugia malayi]
MIFKLNVENLRHLNLKRPKLLISTKWNYFINWTQTENGCIFHDSFNGDIRAVENDLRQIDGLRDFVINPRLSVCDNNDLNVLARSSSAEFYIDHRKSMIRVSPWRYTLTELHLGSYIRNDGIEYIGHLHSLKVFSWGLSLYTFDEEFAHIKNLYNLEELRVWFGGQDCNVTPEGLITLFTLPQNEPEKSFPYKLKHLVISNYLEGTVDLFRVIDQNCPNLRTLGLPFNDYLPFNDGVMPFIVSNFKRLFFLDLSNFGDHYKDEVWDNLDDRNLPDLRLLILHGNKVNVENLRRLNLKRPKLLISTKWNYFINWTQTENGCIFHDSFNGDIRAVENDLRQIDGLRDFVINPRLSVCDNNDLNVLARSSSAEFYIDHRKRSYSSDHSV